jgi:hypothetical protein
MLFTYLQQENVLFYFYILNFFCQKRYVDFLKMENVQDKYPLQHLLRK